MTDPVLALTLGDPAGVGPEITVRTMLEPPEGARCVAVGDAAAVHRAIAALDVAADVRVIDGFADAVPEPGRIDVVDLGISGPDLAWGEVSAVAGHAAVAAIERATRAAMADEVAAVVTAPINKEAIWAAGTSHLGHTEMLGELTGAASPQTMFVVDDLKIFFTTRHLSLREALDALTVEAVRDAIADTWQALQVLGHDRPRLAVAAVNPHGGEGGKFGREELDVLIPACEAARADGMEVIGPVPADSVFFQGLEGRFDAVLSQFHDQGHIAAKTYDFQGAITVTMGLPVLRTSVDHGTAFDIAGTGAAHHRGMVVATQTAARYADRVPAFREAYGARSPTGSR